MFGLLQLFALAAGVIVVLGTIATVRGMTHPPRLTFGAALGRGLPASPTDAGFAHTEHRLELSTQNDDQPDTTVAWLVPGALPAPAPIFVVTHAWGDSRYATQQYLPLLVPLASHVLLYDLRGQGDSTPDACDVGTTEVDDLVRILDQLEGLVADGAPIVLFGASMGAGISIAAAARPRDPSVRPIAAVIGDGGYRRGMEPIDGHFRRRGYPVFPFHYTVGAYLSMRYATDREFDRARHAALLRCPLLLLHGTADRVCPFESAREITQASPRGTLVAFDGLDHLQLLEKEPEKMRAAVTEFLHASGLIPSLAKT